MRLFDDGDALRPPLLEHAIDGRPDMGIRKIAAPLLVGLLHDVSSGWTLPLLFCSPGRACGDILYGLQDPAD